jgi:tetratricopeptide (TPR) repeat protein
VRSVAGRSRRITLIVVWNALAAAQTLDLSPLLPSPTPETQAISDALLAGNVPRAGALVKDLAPGSRDLWLGILAIAENNSTRAIRFLRRTDNPKALGVAYYLARQHLLFRQQMEEAIRLSSSDFGPYYYLGRHYDADIDNPEEAARWFRQALERNPDHPRSHAYLGSCLERLGRSSQAETEYLASAGTTESQLGLSRLRLAAGDAHAALQHIQKAIALDSRSAKAQKLAARIYLSLGLSKEAAGALESAAVLAPQDAAIHYQLYRTWQTLGQQTKAAAALKQFERIRAIYGIQPQ